MFSSRSPVWGGAADNDPGSWVAPESRSGDDVLGKLLGLFPVVVEELPADERYQRPVALWSSWSAGVSWLELVLGRGFLVADQRLDFAVASHNAEVLLAC